MAQALAAATRKKDRPFTVLIEGNIGSGKTTFLEHFKKFDNVCVLAEPIQLWRNCNGHNFLGLMYEDPQRWAFAFQSYVQLTMMELHTQPTPHSIKLMERSIYSARYCFVEKMARDGILPGPSASVLNEWFKWAISNVDLSVDLIIYLRTTPEIVYERMRLRNRSEEKSVPLEYLQELHKIHEDWLYHKTLFTCPAPVLTLNADKDKTLIVEEYEKCEPSILNRVAIEV